ncbi:hypothetical protein PTTG_30669, partial [Puccinia triticina 1-1 BBBD Race 1]
MRGIPIRYGIKPKNQQDIAHSIGWIKPTKRQRAAMNDGRPPDTTQALVDHPTKRVKLGRPPKSLNINRAMHTTFMSYAASKDSLTRNRCWLAAALDSLYAIYSPLWLQSPGGKNTSLFHTLVSHFTSRTTNELIQNKNLKSILTRGSNKLFEAARSLHPDSFIPGSFASCDFFMEIILDPKTNSSEVLKSLFSIQETREFSCPRKIHKKPIDHPRGDRRLVALKVTNSMFEANAINCADAGLLITRWSTSGLAGTSGLQCQSCGAERSKKPRRSKPLECEDNPSPSNFLEQTSIISFPDGKSPPHLYFQIDSATIIDEQKQVEFMGEMNWPFKLTISGE